MTQLIVTRKRQLFGPYQPPFAIVIDEEKAAPIRCGQTIGIELPPGRYEMRVKVGHATSDFVHVEAGAEGEQRFEVGPRLPGWIRALAFLPAAYFLAVPIVGLSTQRMFYFVVLPSLATSAVLTLCSLHLTSRKTQLIDLKPLPDHGPEGHCAQPSVDAVFNYADLPPTLLKEPFRLRFTVRGIMIAVAIVALVIWLGLGSVRSFRQAQYQRRAEMHAKIEAIWRENEQRQNEIVRRQEQLKLDSKLIQTFSTRSAALADHHQAMRQKYERAAALGLLSVEPDPPEPPRP